MIDKFAWKLDEALCRTLPFSDWHDMPNIVVNMDILTEALDREVDYVTEAFR